MHFRKKRTLEKYRAYMKDGQMERVCDFCAEMPQDKKKMFTHWKIFKNIFPYDRIAEEHDLLVPKRHFRSEAEMTPEEREELVHIKTHLLPKKKTYDVIWENFSHLRSVAHYHIHLLCIKKTK